MKVNSGYDKSEVLRDILELAKTELNKEGNIGFTMPDGRHHIFIYVDDAQDFLETESFYVIEPNRVIDGAHEPMGDTAAAKYNDFAELLVGCSWCMDQFAHDISLEKDAVQKDRIEIDLGVATLVAEKGSYPNYKELFVGLEDAEGVWIQDLAVLGSKYHYENDTVVFDPGVSLKIWTDKDNEDFTHDFSVGIYTPEKDIEQSIYDEKTSEEIEQDPIYTKICSSLKTVLDEALANRLPGEEFIDVCVEVPLAAYGHADYALVVWGEENDADDKFYSVSVYKTDRDGMQEEQICDLFSDSADFEDVDKTVCSLLASFEQKHPRGELLPELHDILCNDETFRYRLLSRMQADCNYYLGYGGRHNKYLWAPNEKAHIGYMKEIWKSFPQNKKPEWLSFDNILDYEKKMVGSPVQDNEREQSPAVRSVLGETIWITVYKDTLGHPDDHDNLTEICVPTHWLLSSLKYSGEEFAVWLSEYTADETEFIAEKAMEDKVILDCSDHSIREDLRRYAPTTSLDRKIQSASFRAGETLSEQPAKGKPFEPGL